MLTPLRAWVVTMFPRRSVSGHRFRAVANLLHRGFDNRVPLLWRQLDELRFDGQFDVCAEAIGPSSFFPPGKSLGAL